MKIQKWIEQVRINKEELTALVEQFHPMNLKPHWDHELLKPEITAVNAEKACEVIRDEIRNNFLGDPVKQFQSAVKFGEIGDIISLLEASWHGVPESTSCWLIPGFATAVYLLDDPPEQEDDGGLI